MKKNETKTEQPSWKIKLTGILFFPVAVFFWCIDRFIHIIMPHSQHPSFVVYLDKPDNIRWTIARIILLIIPILLWKIFWWIF